MDKYLLAIIGIIISSIIIILYIRISARILKDDSINPKPVVGDSDSARYDNVECQNKTDPLLNLKSDDFTLLE